MKALASASRRTVLAGAYTALVAAPCAATAPTDDGRSLPPGRAASAGTDAELIGLCERLVLLERQRRVLIDSRHTAAAEQRTEPELVSLYGEAEAVMVRLFALRGPTTAAGAHAMARAAIAEWPRDRAGSLSWQGRAEWLAVGVAEFLAGEPVA